MKLAQKPNTERKPVRTPGLVWLALGANLALLTFALVYSKSAATTAAEGTRAVWLFAGPMALIFLIGAATASWTYLWSRREAIPIPRAAFLPVSVFVLGVIIALALAFGVDTMIFGVPMQHSN
ncbi:MAG: hypothetical protein ABI824_03835 [Acidobacteriota bacterium]